MNMFYGVLSSSGVPADEQEVRATTETIDVAEPAAVMQEAPTTGKLETDSGNGISGIHNHQLASQWIAGEKFVPSWIGKAESDATNSVIIDGQVATSGTAAAREASGQFGHGSMSYAVGIEPVQGLSPGGVFGENYFAVDKPAIQSTMGSYMSQPPGYDKQVTALVSDTTKRNARYAQQATLYANFLGTDI